MLRRPLRDTARGTRERVDGLRMKKNSVYAEEARRTKNGTYVVWVLHTFHHKDNSTLKVRYFFKDITRCHQLERSRLYHHPFVMFGSGDPSDLIVLSYLEGNPFTLGPLKHVVKEVLSLGGNKDPLDIASTSFKDRETALNAVVLYSVLFVEMGWFILGCTSPSFALCGTRM
jgi:hypothetical protein